MRATIKYFLYGLLLISQSTIAQGWVPVGTTGFSTGVADETSRHGFVFDSKGVPYIINAYGNSDARVRVMKFADTSWVEVGNGQISSGVAFTPAIAIGANDTPIIAYTDVGTSSGGPVAVLKYDGNSWVAFGSDTDVNQDIAFYNSIAVDRNNTPYVAYGAIDNSHVKATVLKFDGSNWVLVGNHGFSPGKYAHFTSIAIDSAGTPYVLFEDVDSGFVQGQATVMKYDGNNWVLVGNRHFSAGYVRRPSISIDRNGTPYVAYENYLVGNSSGKATVMKYDGNSWILVGGDYVSNDETADTDMAIDSDNIAYIAYREATSLKAVVKKYKRGVWQTVGNAGFSAGDARFFSIAFDSSNVPFVKYTDYAHGGKATVMKYTGGETSINEPVIETNFTIHPNPSAGMFHISFAEKITNLLVYDVQGRLVIAAATEGMDERNATVDLAGNARGVYFFRATLLNGIMNGKLVLE